MLSKLRPPLHRSIRCCYKSTVLSAEHGQETFKSYKDIPGPPPVKLRDVAAAAKKNEGNLHEFNFEQTREYGRISQTVIPTIGVNVFLISDPDYIEQFLRQEAKIPRRPEIPIWNKAIELNNAVRGILTSNDDSWLRMRTAVNQPILKPANIETYYKPVNEVTSELIERFIQIRGDNYIVEDLAMEFFHWALESVCTVLFERRLGCIQGTQNPQNDEFIKAVRDLFKTTADLFMYPPFIAQFIARKKWKLHVKSWNVLFTVAEDYTNQKLEELKGITREDGDQVGIIEYLSSTGTLSKKEVYSAITELMGGGVETTSNASQFAMYEIAKNPEVQNQLFAEIQENVGNEPMISSSALRKMHYLKAVIKETLRLYPPVNSVGRVLTNDIILGEYKIPKGKWVHYSPYVMGRLDSLFKDPSKFKPERWLRSVEDKDKVHPFAYVPFGFGTRMCVGRRVAELEMQILLIQMVRRFQLQLVDDKPIELYCDVSISPANPLRLKYLDRN